MNAKTELDRIKTTITVSKRLLNKLKKIKGINSYDVYLRHLIRIKELRENPHPK